MKEEEMRTREAMEEMGGEGGREVTEKWEN